VSQELSKLTVSFEGDASDFIKACQAAGKAADSFAKDTEEAADRGSQAFAKWVKGTATEINSVMSLIGRATSAFESLFSLLEDTAKSKAAETYFVNAGKSLEMFRQATHGLLSDADLMKKSNLADSMGVSTEAFLKLANVAHAAALKTGQSYEYMFDSIITGTARASRLLLDNLGIIVSVKEANQRYAQSLKDADVAGQYHNKTIEQIVKSLTKQQTQEAFVEEVMRKSQGTLDEYAKTGGLAADNYSRFHAALENLKKAIGDLASDAGPLGAVASALQSIASAIERIAKFGGAGIGESALAGLKGAGKSMLSLAKGPLGTIMDEKASFGDKTLSVVQLALPAGLGVPLSQLTGGAGGAIAEQDTAATKAENQLSMILIRTKDDMEKAGVSTKEALTMSTDKLSSLDVATQSLVASFLAFNKMLGNKYHLSASEMTGEAGPPGVMPPGKVKKEHEGFLAIGGPLYSAIEKKINDEYDRDLAYIEKVSKLKAENEQKAGQVALEDAQKDQERLEREKLKEITIRQEWNKKIKEMMDAQDAAVKTAVIGAGESLAKGDASGFVSAISTAIGTIAGQPEIGAAIGAVLGPLIGALEPVIVLFGDIAKGVGQLVKLALLPFLNALLPLGPSLEFLLAAVGAFIGEALQPIIPLFATIIDGISLLISGIAWAVVVLAPFADMVVSVALVLTVLWDAAWALGELFADLFGFQGMTDATANWTAEIDQFTHMMIGSAVDINNAIVGFVQGLGGWAQKTFGTDFGLSSFGQMLSADDFENLASATQDNSKATDNNTKAVKNLSEELRNLPSGYKIAAAQYDSQQGVRPVRMMTEGSYTGPRAFYRGRM
jgi:hypothetical protein